jgi:hypothetical protein
MSVNEADFPGALWDGLGPNRTSRMDDKRPDFEDWDQLVAEVMAMQDDSIIPLVAASGVTVLAGQAVAVNSSGEAILADCNGAGEIPHAIGLALNGAAPGETVYVKTHGVIELTIAQWDAAGTDASGIDPGVTHWLSGTAGMITPTKPTTMGDVYCRIGVGLTATKLFLKMDFDGVDPS